MSNPNIVNVATISGKSAVSLLSASYAAQVTNSAASSKILKINTVIAANTNTTTAVSVSLDFYRSSTSYPIASTISVPANSSIILVAKDTPIYLEESDAIRALGGVANYINMIVSYEEIS